METPFLGLAYTKTAALPSSWDDMKSLWKKTAPTWLGGNPTTTEQPTQPQQPSQPTPPPPAQPAATPAQTASPKLRERADLVKRRKQDLVARRERQRAADAIHGPAREKSRMEMDANIAAGTRQNDVSSGRNPLAAEQGRREKAGDWAWRSAQGLGGRTARGNPVSPTSSKGDPGYSVPGMTSYDLSHAVNRFQDRQALEGQNARGMGGDEFQRYMAREYPQQAAASRAKYDKPEIAWKESDPMYKTAPKTPGKAPIQWQPTTYEQAQRMGVLNGNKLKAPGSEAPMPQMRSYGGGVSASLTPAQQANLEAGGGWSPRPKQQAPRGLGADTNQAGISSVVDQGASTDNAMPTRLGTPPPAPSSTAPVKPAPAADKMKLGL